MAHLELNLALPGLCLAGPCMSRTVQCRALDIILGKIILIKPKLIDWAIGPGPACCFMSCHRSWPSGPARPMPVMGCAMSGRSMCQARPQHVGRHTGLEWRDPFYTNWTPWKQNKLLFANKKVRKMTPKDCCVGWQTPSWTRCQGQPLFPIVGASSSHLGLFWIVAGWQTPLSRSPDYAIFPTVWFFSFYFSGLPLFTYVGLSWVLVPYARVPEEFFKKI